MTIFLFVLFLLCIIVFQLGSLESSLASHDQYRIKLRLCCNYFSHWNHGLPRKRSQGFVRRSGPTNVYGNERLNSLPIVRKYQLDSRAGYQSANGRFWSQSVDKQQPLPTYKLGKVWYLTKEFCSGQECRKNGLAFCISLSVNAGLDGIFSYRCSFGEATGGIVRCNWTKGRRFFAVYCFVVKPTSVRQI